LSTDNEVKLMFIFGFPVVGLQYMTNGMEIFRMAAENKAAPVWNGDKWRCICGQENSTNFCPECGMKAPVKPWKCSCGRDCTTNFCPDCGARRSASE
jgi:membrane protease subunit (stomatin/prohibitin family)